MFDKMLLKFADACQRRAIFLSDLKPDTDYPIARAGFWSDIAAIIRLYVTG